MNQHLQSIQNFIQQSEHLSDEEKTALLKATKDANEELEITSFKLDHTEKVKRTTAILLEETIEELQQKRKAVEAQNRELEIESSLERVRTVAMSMKEAADMLNVCHVISAELEILNVQEIRNVQTAIFYKEKGTYMNYEYYARHDKKIITETSYTNSEMHRAFATQMLKGAGEFFTTNINGDEVKDWIAYQKTTNVFIDHYLYTTPSLNYYWFSLGPVALGISTYSPLNQGETNLFKRFVKVFELAYRRYLDIEKAEAQAKEAKIEAALEKVRSRSLAVHYSNEFKEVITVVFEKLQELGIIASSVSINIFIEGSKDAEAYICGQGEGKLSISHIRLVYFDHPISNDRYNAQKSGLDFFSKTYTYKEKNSFFEYLFEISDLKYLPDDIKKMVFGNKSYTISLALAKNSMIVINDFEGNFLSEKDIDTVKRFSRVFEQAYIRFLDLQKAEAQAKEAQIEAALERVRSRTMGMQKSEELKEVIQVVYEQFVQLDILIEHTGFIMDYRASDDMNIWLADQRKIPSRVTIPYFDSPHWNSFIEAKEKDIDFFSNYLSFEEKNRFYQELFKLISGVPDDAKEYYFNSPALAISTVLLENVGLYIENFSGIPYTDEENNTLMRFGKVFQQTYTRFLDLQKAEAQSRESQIQLALERVRARTMAMQKSNELADAATLLFRQVNDLGIKPWTAGFNIWSDDNNAYEDWIASPAGGFIEPYVIDARAFSEFKALSDAKKSGTEFFIRYQEGDTLKETYKQLSRFANKNQFEKILEEGFQFPSRQFVHLVFGSKVSLMFITYEPVPEAHDIFIRFGRVFEQTYTRFLDLQKAEAQAREATIEAALDKVRSVAMSMMKSHELISICEAVFKQLQVLGFTDVRAAQIYIRHDENEKFLNYDYSDISGADIVEVSYNSHPNTRRIYDVIRDAGDALVDNVITKQELDEWKSYLYNTLGQPPEKDLDNATELHYYLYSFGMGAFGICTFKSINDDELQILKRFRNVFSLSYQRYADIALAEAQAREAKIEAALERVRSRTLAMQKSDELAETAAVLFKQLILLGIEPNRLYINIIKDESGESEFWITDEDGSKVSSVFESNMNDNLSFKKMYEGWKEKKKSLMIDMTGKELKEYFQHLKSIHVPFKEGLIQKRRLQYIAYFNKGFIGMASPEEQPEETVLLLERFAAVFNLTFTRFNDLKVAEAHAIQAEEDLIKLQTEKIRAEDALTELKETQKQLIQSEKMASLGELTAGIAHEIQNPLNFVNNFSEVSKELLDEMKSALDNGDEGDVKEIVNNVIQNLEKINYHGKRADAIVKGMLQHSRSGTSKKEPTDFNGLCDEYIRLCYHGLRAKDNSFNAAIKTDFDSTIKKINIIPQDIGRVILNILTNAFYAVNEKKKTAGENYKPTISIQTRKLNDKIQMTVEDNGNGISQNIVDKIFQPFFTTKPTGQGTGLGLSLSYDIIKTHGGEIKVEAIVQGGSKFIIQLPVI